MYFQSLDREDPQEEEMATHSSMIVGKTSWTEEFGRLKPIGSQKVRHDWATKHTHTDFLYLVVAWLLRKKKYTVKIYEKVLWK